MDEPPTMLATDENMPYILMALEAADEVAIDTETTGLDVRNRVDYLR
jgi:DNA polymerase III epsilon subunit-like protein